MGGYSVFSHLACRHLARGSGARRRTSFNQNTEGSARILPSNDGDCRTQIRTNCRQLTAQTLGGRIVASEKSMHRGSNKLWYVYARKLPTPSMFLGVNCDDVVLMSLLASIFSINRRGRSSAYPR